MAEAWYRALQLERDPFVVPGPFFSGGGRRQLLQQVVQQLHFSRGSVLLLGEAGSGVTTLLEAAVRQLSGIADTLLVSADDMPSPETLWAALTAASLGWPGEAVRDAEAWLAARRQYGPRDGSALPVVLAVDDAQRLDDAVLRQLQQLEQVAPTELRLLLGAEPALVPRLSTGVAHRLQLRLPALDCAAIADYVLTRLQAAGYAGELPLDDLQLEALRQHSGGIPGRIHAQLPPLLSSPPPSVSAQTLRSLPITHLLGVAGLMTAVVIAALYWGGAEVPGADEPGAAAQARETRSLPLVINDAPAQSAASASPPATAEPSAAPAPSSAAPAAPAAPATTPAAPAPPPESAAPVQPDPATAVPEALSGDERALLELPAGSYLLQLFAARDRQRVIDFARDAPAGLRIYRFETRLSGAPWHVAVAGPYADDAAARAAAARLPADMRSARPWPRSQADIAQAIRDLHSIRN